MTKSGKDVALFWSWIFEKIGEAMMWLWRKIKKASTL